MKYTKEQIEKHAEWAQNACWSGLPNWFDWVKKSLSILKFLLTENERYRAALEVYADRANYKGDFEDEPVVMCDRGDKARDTLKGGE